MGSQWNSDAAIKWLESFLVERFGIKINIKNLASESLLNLSIPGESARISLDVSGKVFTRHDSDLPCAIWDPASEGLGSYLLGRIPAPGLDSLHYPLIAKREYGFHIHYDILGFIYWMLTRNEEIGRTDLDAHGRFPASSSHAYKHGYLERPIVDEWLQILGQVIERTWPGIELKNHSFSMKVSHDVDEPSRYGFRSLPSLVRAMAGDIIRRRDMKSSMLAPWVRMNTRNRLSPLDPYNTFDWIMDLSDQHGLTSAFYFICGRSLPAFDADYEPDHPAIRLLMRRIHERGHEIGLHPSYSTYQRPALLKSEADRLHSIADEEGIKQSEWGGRMHYLRWENPTTLRAWADAGMAYDSTLSYADRPGFRCGTCFEYPAFDPVAGEILPLRIRPLIAMECSVISDGYLGFGAGSVALDKFMSLKSSCRAVSGCFTLLWHNSQFDTNEKREIYRQVLC